MTVRLRMRNTELVHASISAGEHDGQALPIRYGAPGDGAGVEHRVELYAGACTSTPLIASTIVVACASGIASLPCNIVSGRRYLLVYRLGREPTAPIGARFAFTPAP